MRLLNKAYPIVWDEMVLKQLYQKYGCENNEEEQEKLRNKKNIQLEYQIIVDNIIDESKAGELDDQEHFREDITKILCYAIREAAKGFKSDDDDKKKSSKDEDEDEEELKKHHKMKYFFVLKKKCRVMMIIILIPILEQNN